MAVSTASPRFGGPVRVSKGALLISALRSFGPPRPLLAQWPVVLTAVSSVSRQASWSAQAKMIRSGGSPGKTLRARVNADRTEIECASAAEAPVLLWAAHVAPALLGRKATSADLAPIEAVTRGVFDRLNAAFTEEEIAAGQVSGFPGLKEAILYLLVRTLRPERVIETGVAQGISTTFILEAMAANGRGHLVSVDLPSYAATGGAPPTGVRGHRVSLKAGFQPGWLVPEPLRNRWELILGDAKEVLPRLPEDPPDLFVHDSLHTYEHMMFELEWAFGRQHPGSAVVCDDADWNPAFRTFLARHPGAFETVVPDKVGVAFRVA
jgi:predicted O-methyltransferase YrrM